MQLISNLALIVNGSWDTTEPDRQPSMPKFPVCFKAWILK